MKEYKYIIIGSGPSGISAIEGIRMNDKKSKILVISKEEFGYSRPLITYYFSGKIDREDIFYRNKNYFTENNAQQIKGTVQNVDAKKKTVELEDNRKFKFIKLLIASGGNPFIPPIKGSDKKGVIKFNSIQDAEKIISGDYKKSAVVLGAGMIGMKTAEAFKNRGWEVHLLELKDRLMPQVLDEQASDILKEVIKQNRINIHLSNTIDEIKGEEAVEKVKLKTSEEIEAGVVVMAIGVRPNFDFLPDAGQKAVEVDSNMKTKYKDIYAAGDVVESTDIIDSQRKTIAIWPLAYRQGRVAGINMSGGNSVYTGGWLMNSISLFNFPIITMGNSISEKGEFLTDIDKLNRTYKKIILKENKVIGAILMGNIDRAGIYNGIMENKVDVSSFKQELLDEDFSLISVPKKYKYREISPLEI